MEYEYKLIIANNTSFQYCLLLSMMKLKKTNCNDPMIPEWQNLSVT